jgi:hypothetical protein
MRTAGAKTELQGVRRSSNQWHRVSITTRMRDGKTSWITRKYLASSAVGDSGVRGTLRQKSRPASNSQADLLPSIRYGKWNVVANAKIGNGVCHRAAIGIDVEYLKIASEISISAEHRNAALLK